MVNGIEDKFLIAESESDFNCNSWKDVIISEVTNSKFKELDFDCPDKDSDGNPIYRLYAQEKVKLPENKGNKLPAGAIAGIVIGVVVVVGAVIFLLVYFLVFKKEKQQ